MQISNTSSFTDSAKNVIARSYVNGDKWVQQVTITDSDNAAIDVTNYSFDLDVVFGTSSATVGGSSSNPVIVINNLSLVSDDSTFRSHDNVSGSTVTLPGKDISSEVSLADATSGIISIQWPEDLYEGYVPFNTSTDIPVVVGTLRYGNASTPATSTKIDSIRFLQFVRYGATVA